MKVTFAFVCLVALCIYTVSSLPVGDDLPNGDAENAEHFRVKRVTCDLLSAEARGVKINNAACAAHCLVKGRRGGYCNGKGVCVCR